MNPIIRGVVIYVFLLVLFRILGKRSLSQITTFDFVMLLIIGEVTQQALLGQDYSMTNALVLIIVLIGLDLMLSKMKSRFNILARLIEGAPLIVVENGKPLKTRMRKSGVDEEDILEAARLNFGIMTMQQIKYAILERDGEISIIPE
ncbi:MAG TPA: YetF domain-containing protein [Anseongella sp.]|nr:YetF domain-containing protein [Anseongella sp.]